ADREVRVARRDLCPHAPAFPRVAATAGVRPIRLGLRLLRRRHPALGPMGGRHRRRLRGTEHSHQGRGAHAAALGSYGRGDDRFGLIHADVRLANLLVDGDDIQVIDFDDCGFGWFMFDLATAVSFMEHDPRVPELCDAWVRGYRRVLPLPAADEAEI